MAGIKTAWNVFADEISADVLGVAWLAKKTIMLVWVGYLWLKIWKNEAIRICHFKVSIFIHLSMPLC